MQARLRLVKDVQEDGNVTIDLFLLVSVLTEEICVTTAKVPAIQPSGRPYDVCLGVPGTRGSTKCFNMGQNVLDLGYMQDMQGSWEHVDRECGRAAI